MNLWQKKSLQEVYSSTAHIGDAWAERNVKLDLRKHFPMERRLCLVEVLKEQYRSITTSDLVVQNIDKLLLPNCYTITTGQQIVVGLGPWMILYKIASTIVLSKQYKSEFPESEFVPIFWMATEDHDWAEIAQIQNGSKKLSWHTSQTGAVGRMHCEEVVAALNQWNADFPADAIADKWLAIYQSSATLSEATRRLVDAYFNEFGLVVIDPDDQRLKSLAMPIFKDDAENQTLFKVASQLGVQSGEIEIKNCNLFSLENNSRSRLDPAHFDKLSQRAPGDLSPNVALRILFQEYILPNVVYVGGPSEQRYWKQVVACMKEMNFPHASFSLRERGAVVPEKMLTKWLDRGLSSNEWNWSEKQLKEHFLSHWGPLPLHDISSQIELLFQKQIEDIRIEDPTLLATWEGDLKKTLSGIEQMKGKIERARKRKDAETMQWVERWIETVWPGNALQERNNYWIIMDNKKAIPIKEWLDSVDPLDPTFKIWSY